ncbi:MAG TPA: anaerobic ribonucleoside-triphosphate reductase activating protein [Euryarchaeota archaeon]|nr:anaerobic ribonucleoside-triphosphate reductase activating protein [Euryarchaeota archaeon]
MFVGGVIHFTLIDFPGRIACTVFTVGCTFRCPFCYNKDLVLGNVSGTDVNAFFQWLESRKGKIEGVVVTGGEPTIQKDLPAFLERIKGMGFDTKLDTNGADPAMLKKLLELDLLDYVAMDVKAPFDAEKFSRVTGVKERVEDVMKKVAESVDILLESGIPYEFRTTVVPTLHGEEEIRGMGEIIRGARLWALQGFRPEQNLIDPKMKSVKPYPPKVMQRFADIAREYVARVELRGV